MVSIVLTVLIIAGNLVPLIWPFSGVAIGLTLGWSITLAGFFVWLHNHRRHRAKMITDLIRMMYVSDYTLTLLIAPNKDADREIMVRFLIKEILRRTTAILAYRVEAVDKSAALLVLEDDSDGARFSLFTDTRDLSRNLVTNLRQ
jgi:hypothetical protein